MTRINVIPVEELSDQWLLAEYRELPRCIKQDINTKDAPKQYKLGTGHMKWAKAHSLYLVDRFYCICKEMQTRGFKIQYLPELLHKYALDYAKCSDYEDYTPINADIITNRKRLIERYQAKPDFYRWTGRNKPIWITSQKEK